MQEHVKLEVSLEVINNIVANTIKQLNCANDKDNRQKLEKELEFLWDLKDKAYSGDKIAIEKILNLRKEYN